MSLSGSWIGLSPRRLRWFLGSFFVALAIPTAVLIRQTYRQLQWESYYQHRVLAEELAARIDSRLKQLVAVEEARPRSEYAFLVLAGDPSANFVVRSPLSGFPVRSPIPGLIGYFQIDEQGLFSTPLLPPVHADPARYGISARELKRRRESETRLKEVLVQSHWLGVPGRRAAALLDPPLPASPSTPLPSLAVGSPFDPFAANGESGDAAVWLDDGPSAVAAPPARARRTNADPPPPSEATGDRPRPRAEVEHFGSRRSVLLPPAQHRLSFPPHGPHHAAGVEHGAMPKAQSHRTTAMPPHSAQAPLRIMTFDNHVDPFELTRIDTGHFLLLRSVWREGRRAIQGALIDPERFLQAVVERDFRQTAVSRMSELEVAYRGLPLLHEGGTDVGRALLDTKQWRGDVLFRTRLSPPLSDIELVFTIAQLPAGPGAAVVFWLGGILAVVLSGGCWLLYRLGLRQIAAAQQQQNFVAAVSHELKTPLTSIRMYGEMLREGWVAEDRRASCYDFICTECERLSRLIANVLQLARITSTRLAPELKTLTAAELLAGVQPRIAAQIAQSGFVLRVDCLGQAAATTIKADEDYFAQIAINLVDNAIKFCSKSPDKRIELRCARESDKALVISVRDFGPGIPKDRVKKIFRLFYRGENERVRETVGTGIGLALVQQLAAAMNASVDVINRDPGAEFRIGFRPCEAAPARLPTADA